MKLPKSFTLSGKTNENWKTLTSANWNRMLPKEWVDKGHFYSRIKKRGPEIGIITPSDLETEIRSGTVSIHDEDNNRFSIATNIINSSDKYLCILYDYNKSKKRCELVTITF